LAFLAKYLPKVLTKISATGMVEAALAPLHIKGGSPCEYPHSFNNFNVTFPPSFQVNTELLFGSCLLFEISPNTRGLATFFPGISSISLSDLLFFNSEGLVSQQHIAMLIQRVFSLGLYSLLLHSSM